MATATLTMMTVNRYFDGVALGDAKVNEARYEDLAQWPEGLIEAANILSTKERERLGLKPNETVYLT